MAGEWRETTLGAETHWTSGGTPSKDEPSYWNGDLPWISAVSMKTTRLADSDLRITATGLENGSRLADTSSVLILVRGSELHKRIPIGIATRPLAFNQDVKALKAREGLLPEFLLYWLLGNESTLLNKVEHTGIGAGKLDTEVLKNMTLRLPGVSEQRAIARILGTLDDKIELHQRMTETAEAMAQALFKSWFVDFDPVHARIDGRNTELPNAFADLFPSRFVDSELGEIPEGWKVCGLDEAARFLNGLALQRYPPESDQALPVIKIAQLRAGNVLNADRASAAIPGEYVVDDGDVLFSWSGTLEVVLWAGGKGALNQHLFRVTSKDYPKWFFYLWIVDKLPTFRRIAAAKATTMGHIQRHHLAEAKIVMPPRAVLNAADLHLGPLVESIPKRLVQSRTLAALRDQLLPQLISGKLRVADPDSLLKMAL